MSTTVWSDGCWGKRKKIIKSRPLEDRLDLSGEYSFPNMSTSRVNGEPEVRRVLIDEFQEQEGVKMFSRLPDYDNSHRCDLPNGEN